MKKENRKLCKKMTFRLTEDEKKEISNLLSNKNITVQDLVRGYILNLVEDTENTPIYKKAQ